VTNIAYNTKMRLTAKQVQDLPTLFFEVDQNGAGGGKGNNNKFVMEMDPTSYLERTKGGYYEWRIFFSERSGGVLGANFMRHKDVVFNKQDGKIGFAKANCDYATNLPPPPTTNDDNDVTDIPIADDQVDQINVQDCELSLFHPTEPCHEISQQTKDNNEDTRKQLLLLDGQIDNHPQEERRNLIIKQEQPDSEECVDGKKIGQQTWGVTIMKLPSTNGGRACPDPLPSEIRSCSLSCDGDTSNDNDNDETNDDDEKDNNQETCNQLSIWSKCTTSCSQTRDFRYKNPSSKPDKTLCLSRVEDRVCHIGGCPPLPGDWKLMLNFILQIPYSPSSSSSSSNLWNMVIQDEFIEGVSKSLNVWGGDVEVVQVSDVSSTIPKQSSKSFKNQKDEGQEQIIRRRFLDEKEDDSWIALSIKVEIMMIKGEGEEEQLIEDRAHKISLLSQKPNFVSNLTIVLNSIDNAYFSSSSSSSISILQIDSSVIPASTIPDSHSLSNSMATWAIILLTLISVTLGF